MRGHRNDMPKVVLRSTLGYLEREAKRRAEGGAARRFGCTTTSCWRWSRCCGGRSGVAPRSSTTFETG